MNTSDIRAIQITEDSCRVTTASIAVKQQLALSPLTIKDKVLTLSDVCRSVTNVTVKDAPYEMPDDEVIAALADYGNVVEGSIRRGKPTSRMELVTWPWTTQRKLFLAL